MSRDLTRELVEVSIITPCYNGEPFLHAAIRSALAQSFPPIEILVIDDGSIDNSAAVAEAFGPPVRVLRQANQGESVARNRGLAEARGSHILFLDADDMISPDALAHLAAAVEGKPNAVALMGCARFTDDPDAPHRIDEAIYSEFFPEIIDTNFGPPHCWLAPLHLVREAGGFCETMRWSEDWDLLWRLGLHASELVPVSYIGAKYRQHPNSQIATTSQANRARGHAALMARMVTAMVERPDLLDRHGARLFWGAWSALRRARARDVPWEELPDLTRAIEALATRGPAEVRSTGMARAIRWIGVRLALGVQELRGRGRDAPAWA